jgi:predicted RNA-binding Zn ribbon-like protein
MRFSPYPWATRDIVGGNPALDFVNTASGWSSGDPVDRLDGAAGFADWAHVAGLVDDAGLARLRAEIAGAPESAARVYSEARNLRAALWRIFSAVAAGGKARAEDLKALSVWKARTAQNSEIVCDEGGFRRACCDTAPALERPLRLIVDAAEELLLMGPLERLHSCGGERCEWMFLDLSKNGKRRWCSMATCGNDAKVKKFRSRNKSAA